MIPLLILTAALVSMGVEGTGRRVCYYTNWSQYRPNEGKYLPKNINATLCTHIAIAFGKITDTLGPFEWNDESTPYREGTFDQIVKLKLTNPGLKVLLSVGGWNANSKPFNRVLESKMKTVMFAEQAAGYLRKKGMDGLDVDWEYPTNKQNYNTFIQTLKNAFIEEANKSGKERLLLTSAVPAGKFNIDRGFDIPFISKLMDFITVMTYDLHGSWEKYTGHHSAMYAGDWETGPERYLNVDWIMDYWHKLGVPKSKLNLGLPTYGRCFTLESIHRDGVNVRTKGASTAGKYTREQGFLSYYEICKMIKDGAKKMYIPDQKVPYIVKDDQWCGYDDIPSLKVKLQYVKSKGFGGVAVWSMALDDFNGICGPKYPLMTAIFNEMGGNDIHGYPTNALPEKDTTSADYQHSNRWITDGFISWMTTHGSVSWETTTPKPTISEIKPTDPCLGKMKGFMPHADCKKFYICSNGKGYENKCPSNTLWNQEINICDWESKVICSPSSQI